MKKNNYWYTLIEVLISITIFSIIMVSVISIYIANIDVNNRANINRAIHENVRNLFTQISEDITKNGISGLSEDLLDTSCGINWDYSSGSKLCIWDNQYYLAIKNESWDYIRKDNSDCEEIKDTCQIVKNGVPLTNSHVAIKNLSFYITNDPVKKVTMSVTVQPTTKLWIKGSLIEKNKMLFQTTITQRPF